MEKHNVNKQQLSESRRKESIKLKQREKSSQSKQITNFLRKSNTTTERNSIKFGDYVSDSEVKTNKPSGTDVTSAAKNSKMMLLESSSEDEAEEDVTRFKIKPQFEGERGRQLFEISSSMADERFRLDERFKEAEELREDESSEEYEFNADEDPHFNDEMSSKQEKGKNLAILEQILGIKLPPKPPQGEQSKKRKYVRFDPENESAAEYIRKKDADEKNEAGPKKKKKNMEVIKEPEPLPVVSKERFFHVSADLKEVLGSSEPFSLAQRFNFLHDDDHVRGTTEDQEVKKSSRLSEEKRLSEKGTTKPEKETTKPEKREIQDGMSERTGRMTFFFAPDDLRLKEGVEFFQRIKPMEEIQKQWKATREEVLKLLKKNRRVSLKTKITSKTLQQQKYGRKQFGKKKFTKTSR